MNIIQFTEPDADKAAIIIAEGANVRYRDDGDIGNKWPSCES